MGKLGLDESECNKLRRRYLQYTTSIPRMVTFPWTTSNGQRSGVRSSHFQQVHDLSPTGENFDASLLSIVELFIFQMQSLNAWESI
mmetsp:Transcript_14190/g.20265  ORF Transcript_14190/g.20265 Transcript_14190/m.20265 type:complete len:86 (+) Transcript_14190:2198-2455(+)